VSVGSNPTRSVQLSHERLKSYEMPTIAQVARSRQFGAP